MYRIALIFGPPFVYFPIGQGLFYVHGALINSAPFRHSTGPTARHYRPHPDTDSNLRFSLTFTHTNTHATVLLPDGPKTKATLHIQGEKAAI